MKSIIIREYLESLTESQELDVIFPILLEAMNFHIVSTPKLTKGLAQYGKDVVAVGKDENDGIKKRFYFEIKGGADRHITTSNYSADDGIKESINEAIDRPFTDSSIPGFDNLPVKIVLVHNGEIKANIKETFDGFIKKTFSNTSKKPKKKLTKKDFEFERWDIFTLTRLFSENLFSEYLLTTEVQINQFKRVLLLLNNPQNDYEDFYLLVDNLISELGKVKSSRFVRKHKLIFESFNLIVFIIASYAREYKNLESAKRSLPYLILNLWAWILENGKASNEESNQFVAHFNKIFKVYLSITEEYFKKLVPIATRENGLLSESGGKYEQVGFPVRTLDFLAHLSFFFSCLDEGLISRAKVFSKEKCEQIFLEIVKNNASTRPLLDNHSVSIYLTIERLVSIDVKEAKVYLAKVIESIMIAYEMNKRLPDGGNNLEVVIKYVVSNEKSVYYVDSTSLLMGMLLEYLAIFNMNKEYLEFRKFIKETGTDIGLFVPFNDEQMMAYRQSTKGIEICLFKGPIYKEGYHSEIKMEEDFNEFKSKTKKKKEFEYSYISDQYGYKSLRILAHIFNLTPFFPNEWRHRLY